MTDEELCAEYYRVAGDAADPCVDVAGLRAVANKSAERTAEMCADMAAIRSADMAADIYAAGAKERGIAEARAAYWKAMHLSAYDAHADDAERGRLDADLKAAADKLTALGAEP